jgi:hypothetical protein
VGNLTNVDYSLGTVAMTNLNLAYDKLNRLTNMIDAVGTTVYSYYSWKSFFTMKTFLNIFLRSSVAYLVFIFFVTIFVGADLNRNGNFRFWDGQEMSNGQQKIFYFVQCLLIVVSGYGAFKRMQIDWKLWKKYRSKPKQ